MSNPGNLNLSITRNNAKIYIARILGGARGTESIAMAEEALLQGFNDWQTDRDWEFLLKENGTFTVDSCVVPSGGTTVSAPVASAFDAINVGMAVTGSHIQASTTISSFTRNTDGSIASLVLSLSGVAPGATETLTFGGVINIVSGTSDYNLPTDFWKHYSVRTTSSARVPLTFIRPRDWNRITWDQTITGTPIYYTIYNATSPLSQNKGTYRLRIYPIPVSSDIIKIQYYRRFDTAADPLDMEGVYLYKFLDYCRGLLIATKQSFDSPELALGKAAASFQKAKQSDEHPTEDEELTMKSQMDIAGLYYSEDWGIYNYGTL